MKCLICQKKLTVSVFTDDEHGRLWSEVDQIPTNPKEIWTPDYWGFVTIECGYGSIYDDMPDEFSHKGYICDDCIGSAIKDGLIERRELH